MEELKISYASLARRKKSAQRFNDLVTFHQNHFPLLKHFEWSLPFNFDFYPENKFEVIESNSSNSISFRDLQSNVRYEFHKLDYYILTVDDASALDRVTHLVLHKICSNNLATFTECIRNLKNIHSIDFKLFPNSDELLLWISSLSSLREFTGHRFEQVDVEEFLSNLQTTGPLKLQFNPEFEAEDEEMNEEIHCLVDEFLKGKIISKFYSPWKCNCQDECWNKNPGQYIDS